MDQPDQDSKPSKGKESTPSSKDAPSSTPPKNDKKPPSLEPPGGGDDTSPKRSEKGQKEGNRSSFDMLRSKPEDSKPSKGKESTPSSKHGSSSTLPKNDKKPPSLEPPGGGDGTSPKTSEKGQKEGNISSFDMLRSKPKDSKPTKGKESTPSSKDAPSFAPPKNDKKPPSLEPPSGGDGTSPKTSGKGNISSFDMLRSKPKDSKPTKGKESTPSSKDVPSSTSPENDKKRPSLEPPGGGDDTS